MKKRYVDLHAEITRRTSGLNQFKKQKILKGVAKQMDISIFERIYCLQHGLKCRPLCAHCGKNYVCGFNVREKSYRKWCSARCQASDPSCVAKSKASRLEKYGMANYNGIEKSKRTRYRRNGGKWHACDFGDKVKAGKVAHGHSENWTNTEKRAATVSRRFAENPNMWKDREEKTKLTRVKNGHDGNWNNREKFRQTLAARTDEQRQATNAARRRTCNDIYGCDFPAQNAECRRKTVRTCVMKYGVECTLNTERARLNMRRAMRMSSWNEHVMRQRDVVPMFSMEEYLAGTASTPFKWKCSKCGAEFHSAWDNGYACGCPECSPKPGRKMQSEIAEYVRSIGVHDVQTDNRSVLGGMELDVYSSSRKAAVELDGLFWHTAEGFVVDRSSGRTTGGKDRLYHVGKTERCDKAGLRLLHVTDDEWIHDRRLCMAFIRRAFGIRRETKADSVREIDRVSGERFLRKYSFDKRGGAGVYYGLFKSSRLVSALGVMKSRGRIRQEWQVTAYATVNSFDVVGGFRMLYDFFVAAKRPESVVMYADRRFFSAFDFGDVMDFAGYTKPDYLWVNSTGTKKFKRKQIVARAVGPYDELKTPLRNMLDAGYRRFFDCGNCVFEKVYPRQDSAT